MIYKGFNQLIFKVIQGHRHGCHSTSHLWSPISLSLRLTILYRFQDYLPKLERSQDHLKGHVTLNSPIRGQSIMRGANTGCNQMCQIWSGIFTRSKDMKKTKIKLEAPGQCIPPPKHVLPDLYPDPWSRSPSKFNRLFTGQVPTFPEKFMQISSKVFFRKVANRQTNNDD